MKIRTPFFYIPVALLLAICLKPDQAIAQYKLQGLVYTLENNKKVPVQSADLHWIGTHTGTHSDESGHFEIDKSDSLPQQLMVHMVGYDVDTVTVTNEKFIAIHLGADYRVETVTITADVGSTYLKRTTAVNMEVIGQREILRAACCNLSESFETNPSVEVNFTDAVSGAKQIRMLGLQGTYTQMMRENTPTLRGLAGQYGLSYVPGTWIESIQLTKGAGSVVNGYEAMAGQINLEYMKPQTADRLYYNMYVDQMGRTEQNLNIAHKFNDSLATMFLLHGSGIFLKYDRNKDGFLDNPLMKNLAVMNRWHMSNNKNYESQFGVIGNFQNTTGGQWKFDPKTDRGTTNAYGIGINTRRLEAFGKLGILFPSKPYKSIGNMVNFTRHEQNAFYGLNEYKGTENTIYANIIYQSIIGNTDHKFKTGASFVLDDYDEKFNDSSFKRQEVVPGIFGEYTWTPSERVTLVGGLRADQHNLFGLMVTPRIHTRFEVRQGTLLRLSAGKGYRTPNMWVENSSLWASSRKVYIEEKPQQEVSWNYGISLIQDIKLWRRAAYFTIDFFRTDFQNQLIADMDVSPQEVHIYNLKGVSYSNALQAEFSFAPLEQLEVKTAYKYYDVRTTYHGELLRKPLVPRDRMLITASYKTKYERWIVDATGLRFGTTRLPNTVSNPEAYKRAGNSPAYYIFHLQLTRNFKKFSVYAGTENALNYRQPNAIVSAEQPFGQYFDASMIWGPIEGRRIYAGLRYKIPQK